MRKLVGTLRLTLLSLFAYGQNHGALKFLGIAIDGTEAQFISQLKTKGFTYSSSSQGYKGQFNGRNVDVFIHTNHNLVDRVYVAFPKTTESNIRIEFNLLLSQFKESDKYIELGLNERIPDDEDISYEITVHDKRYQASFSYFDETRDQFSFIDALIDKFASKYSEEERTTLKNSFRSFMNLSEDDRNDLYNKAMASISESSDGDSVFDQSKLFSMAAILNGMQSLADGSVWFMIHELYGQYYIGLYYDNLHNRAHGEDL